MITDRILMFLYSNEVILAVGLKALGDWWAHCAARRLRVVAKKIAKD